MMEAMLVIGVKIFNKDNHFKFFEYSVLDDYIICIFFFFSFFFLPSFPSMINFIFLKKRRYTKSEEPNKHLCIINTMPKKMAINNGNKSNDLPDPIAF